MNRSLALSVPVALALCLGLNGCTIYTHTDTPNRRKPKAKPAAAATATTTNPRVPRRPGTTADAGTVPTVQSKTVFGGGAAGAFHGYAYVIPEGTTKMPNFDELVPFAQLYTDQFDVAPQTFAGGFPGALLQDEWFAIRYTGKVLVPVKGSWSIKIVSDDGAILYLDGVKVLDNDGVHTPKTNIAHLDLEAGEHTLQLDYFQEKKGGVALQLFNSISGHDVLVTGSR